MKLFGFLLIFFIGFVHGSFCPENYNYLPDGKCYRLFPTAIKITSARFQCLNDNATLPIIHSSDQNDVVTNITYSLGFQAWLGLTCSSNGGCTWDDGSPYVYQNFIGNSPNTTLGNCVFLALGGGEKGKWQPTDCNFDLKGTVCQRDPMNVQNCQNPFSTGEDGRCYLSPAITNSHADAEAYCRNYGATLVSIENSQQNSVVEKLASSSGAREIYIGLTYNGNSFVWSDPQAAFNYTHWSTGFPNTNIGACVLMEIGGLYDGEWRNVDCSVGLPFICSSGNGNPPPFTLPPSPSPSISPPNVCPSNPYYQGSGYIYSPGYPNYYGGSLECDYYLFADNNYVAVKLLDFDLKALDYLELFDGNNSLIIRLQGTINLSQWYTTTKSNQMKLIFVSNAGWSGNRGWSLYFEGTNNPNDPTALPWTTALPPYSRSPPNVCPPTYYYNSATIVSSGFPSNYGNELNCTYILQVIPGTVVRITFEMFQLATYDTVSIFDGPDESSPLINTLTGVYSPNSQVFQSTGTSMTIRFLTDSIATAQGFIATFNGVPAGMVTTPNNSTFLPPTTNPGRKCTDGWTHDKYENYCYKYFPNGGYWQQNLQNCGSIGAQLLTIHDGQQETDVLDFIRSLQGGSINRVWIGLKRNFGTWGWSDGTAVSYLAFLPGEPSSAGDCAAIQSYTNPSGWVAVDCNTALPFICYHDALSK